MTCTACKDDLDHCHGTLVLHTIVNIECTDPDCTDLALVRHSLVVDCSDIVGGCICSVTTEVAGVLRAS
ncbi:hypothetical protein [Rhodococcus chondri]|uniref:Uncharacterized protein n=1 Tax=Rhodococcus chondri TaxID=3065941 RepID=A0ABU7JRN5_9NOCA|nr:hypothetical protein [Rhodococcus sp. CC-R104]MEE2032683.1 hypothetical protein [Rhodococcus sp. CC-R104]